MKKMTVRMSVQPTRMLGNSSQPQGPKPQIKQPVMNQQQVPTNKQNIQGPQVPVNNQASAQQQPVVQKPAAPQPAPLPPKPAIPTARAGNNAQRPGASSAQKPGPSRPTVTKI